MSTIKKIAISILKAKNKLVYKNTIIKSIPENSKFTLENISSYNESRKFGYEKNLCNAPFIGLYFGMFGEVTACCLNRKHVLGKVTENSLKEIWNGGKIKDLRNTILEMNLNKGCEHCKASIMAENYTSLVANAYDGFSNTNTTKFPLSVTFETSNTCNLACEFCSGAFSSTYQKKIENKENTISVYDDKFIEELKEFIPYLKVANFLGGEPFLIKEYIKIWELIIKINPNCNIHLQTNGHVLNNKIKSILNRGKFHIGISLESIQEDKFNKIRKFGNFNTLLNNLEYFKTYAKKKGTTLNISVTPIKSTINELPSILDFANKQNIELFFNILLTPYKNAIWNCNATELNNIICSLKLNAENTSNERSKQNVENYKSYIRQIEFWKNEAIKREKYIEENKSRNCNSIIEELLEKMNKYIDYYDINGKDNHIELLKNIERKIKNKLDNNEIVYKEILLKVNTMPTDVMFGNINHDSF